ncbi:MAG: hypothetical protein EU540_04300 [Promethearchaeota archaeon]|nr:MAG: hypothetical protein EU540_04300 [Candidatus Lokiarchaeota archaeon]
MQDLAKSRNGDCLSKKYLGDKVKLRWKCNIHNYEWKAMPHNIKPGHWCPMCANEARSESRNKYWEKRK